MITTQRLMAYPDHYIIWICLQYMCIVGFFGSIQKVCQTIVVFYFNIKFLNKSYLSFNRDFLEINQSEDLP
jgi:hypothetical protein